MFDAILSNDSNAVFENTRFERGGSEVVGI